MSLIPSKPITDRTFVADVHRLPLCDDSVDLVFCSPPYEDARGYGMDFKISGGDWVDWAYQGFVECLRVCRGLVAWVVEGRTRQFGWSATPVLLAARLHEAGYALRKPPIFHRVGIPGSGGPDWLRNDFELVVCAQRVKKRLPWSDNTAMGHDPKYPPGGVPSHRTPSGARVNRSRRRRGDGYEDQVYKPPKKANPGNVIRCNVGGGHLGSKLAYENEAPFPEKLAEFFIRSFCPPEGVVLDPFAGSGTTAAVAVQCGRHFIASDIRSSQIELTRRRLAEKG
ncbi:MAG: DNA-methyltransferase [Phycisphaerae bacterium]